MVYSNKENNSSRTPHRAIRTVVTVAVHLVCYVYRHDDVDDVLIIQPPQPAAGAQTSHKRHRRRHKEPKRRSKDDKHVTSASSSSDRHDSHKIDHKSGTCFSLLVLCLCMLLTLETGELM